MSPDDPLLEVAVVAKRLTSRDVLQRAVELLRVRPFDCPYCALAEAKSRLDDERDTGVSLVKAWRDFARNEVLEVPSDLPLVEATSALRPFCDEIDTCPSSLSSARMVAIVEAALAALS